MARPPKWRATLDASIEEVCLAVRLYNDPAEGRSFAGFVIHMHLAWLYLLHAEFIRDGVDYRHWDPQYKKRLLKVDGEPKRWELERCLRERWPNTSTPVPTNLRLFIRLRNRLEHRHVRADDELMVALAGHAHALLLNYEQELTSQFGDDQSLALRLRIPLFVGTFSRQGEQALRRLRKALPGDLHGFLTDYESGLDEGVAVDPRYEFRLRATVELSPKDPDAVAIQFTRYDDMTEDERAAVEQMGRRGQVIVRDRMQPVSGLGRFMPTPAAAQVQEGIPFIFNQHHFTAAWRRLQVRPPRGATDPSRTRADFCEYDEPTRSYRYTSAYISYLIKKCSTAEGFEEVTGKAPRMRPADERDPDGRLPRWALTE